MTYKTITDHIIGPDVQYYEAETLEEATEKLREDVRELAGNGAASAVSIDWLRPDFSEEKKDAFVRAAHTHYIKHSSASLDYLRDYMKNHRRDWGDDVDGSEFDSLDDAHECGVAAADKVLEKEIYE